MISMSVFANVITAVCLPVLLWDVHYLQPSQEVSLLWFSDSAIHLELSEIIILYGGDLLWEMVVVPLFVCQVKARCSPFEQKQASMILLPASQRSIYSTQTHMTVIIIIHVHVCSSWVGGSYNKMCTLYMSVLYMYLWVSDCSVLVCLFAFILI